MPKAVHSMAAYPRVPTAAGCLQTDPFLKNESSKTWKNSYKMMLNEKIIQVVYITTM